LAQQIVVGVPVTLHGVGPAYMTQFIRAETRVEFPSGIVLTSANMSWHTIRSESKEPSSEIARLQAILGPVRFLSKFDPEAEKPMPVLLTIDPPEYERYRREPAKLTSTLDFYLRRSALVGSLPFREGAALRSGRRWFSVVRSQPTDGCCRVLIHWFDVPPLWAPDESVSYEFILTNRQTGEAVVGKPEFFPNVMSLQFGSLSFGEMDMSAGEIHSTMLRYSPAAADHALGGEWLAGAEIVVIGTRYAGHVSRPLTIDRFIMSPEN
jgi:hypothetical protein